MTISFSPRRRRIPTFLLVITLPVTSAWLSSYNHPSGRPSLSVTSAAWLDEGLQKSSSKSRRRQQQQESTRQRQRPQPLFVSVPDRSQNKDDFVDVDFERIDTNNIDVSGTATTATRRNNNSRKKTKSNKERIGASNDDDDINSNNGDDNQDDIIGIVDNDSESPFGRFKNLIDLSLETGDPKWQQTRVPFVRGEECIDCKLVFTVDLDGRSYGIGIPFDDAVAIVMQETSDMNYDKNGGGGGVVVDKRRVDPKASILQRDPSITKTYNVDPDSYSDDEEYAELMEIFATKVQEEFGEQYTLRKTPKVLTISGGLDKIIDNWERELVTKPFAVKELLKATELPQDEEGMEKELDAFYTFMRQELGAEEFEKTMNEEMTDEDLELMKLFDVPGFGGNVDDDDQNTDFKGLQELVDSMDKDLLNDEVLEAKKFAPDIENSSLRLFSFEFPGTGKSYALVKPLQPYTLVGKLTSVDDGDDDDEEGTGTTTSTTSTIRFELLSADEERVVLPKLEQVCLDDLKANGLTLTGPKE